VPAHHCLKIIHHSRGTAGKVKRRKMSIRQDWFRITKNIHGALASARLHTETRIQNQKTSLASVYHVSSRVSRENRKILEESEHRKNPGPTDLRQEPVKVVSTEMLTQEQRRIIDSRYSERINGMINGEYIHRCPVCCQVAVCNARDRYHNCILCGAAWRNPDY